MEECLQVGAITSTHGLKGEVKVFPTTDDASRFRKLKEVIMDTGKEKISLEIENVKFFKQFVILKFKGFDNINDIEKYKGKELYVTRSNAVKLNKDEYFVADLIGMAVINEDGSELGVLKDVLSTGANDVYVIENPVSQIGEDSSQKRKELLLPAIKQCILNIDMEQRQMIVHLLPGLLEAQ